QDVKDVKDSVGSSWNSAGTWEEKDMSVPARAELEKILTDESFALLDEGGNKVQGFNATVTGDSQAYHIRGRSRLGYEFKVKLSWKGSFGGKEVSGELDIQDLDSSDLDGFDVRPKPKNADSKSAAEALKKGARPAVKKAAEMLSQRLLARSG
ncbi:Aha1_N domain-containing protein, partial [Durusdinium trenchii]